MPPPGHLGRLSNQKQKRLIIYGLDTPATARITRCRRTHRLAYPAAAAATAAKSAGVIAATATSLKPAGSATATPVKSTGDATPAVARTECAAAVRHPEDTAPTRFV